MNDLDYFDANLTAKEFVKFRNSQKFKRQDL